jgi:hypothetical protein
MTYKGHFENGIVVLDEPVSVENGTRVEVDIHILSGEKEVGEGPSLAERFASVIGKAVDLPEDASENHDHYLYGTPKR